MEILEDLADWPEGRAMTSLGSLIQAADTYRQRVASYFNLGWTDVTALVYLSNSEGIGQSELANSLGITVSAATPLMDRLERSKLAGRHPHPADRRRSVIQLTDQGHQVIRIYRTWIRHCFDGIPVTDLDQLAKQLSAMADNLNWQAEHLETRVKAREPGLLPTDAARR